MKKKVIFILAMITTNCLFGQNKFVGINTSNPTRLLDVNGNLAVRKLADKSSNADYSKLLIADASGNVDYILKADLLPAKDDFSSDKEVINSLYSNTTNAAVVNKSLKCGKFRFEFENRNTTTIDAKFALVDQPSTDINIYMSMEQNFVYDGSGFQFYQGKTKSDVLPFTFNSSNYNTLQSFAEAEILDLEQNIMYFQYPGDPAFYRLTLYKVNQTVTNSSATNSFDFVSTCEKF